MAARDHEDIKLRFMNNVRAFIQHKERETFSTCDDNFALETSKLNFIVADGSSSDFFSKIYSRIICDEFAEIGKDCFTQEHIKEMNAMWHSMVEEELKAAGCRPGSFPYVRFQKRDAGCSTLVAFHIEKGEKPTISYYAIGDSVIFFVPAGVSEPTIQISSDSNEQYEFDPNIIFGYTPQITSSYDSLWGEDIRRWEEQELKAGTYYLMTDATAEWFLHYQEYSTADKLKMLDNITSQKEFATFIEFIRAKGAHMDDMTLMRIQIDDVNNIEFPKQHNRVFDYRSLIEKEKNGSEDYNEDGYIDLLDERDKEIDRLKKEVSELETKLTAAENKYEQATADAEEHARLKEDLTLKYEQITNQISTVLHTLAQLNKKEIQDTDINALIEQVSLVDTNYKRLLSQIETLSKTKEDLSERLQEAQNDSRALTECKEQLEEDVANKDAQHRKEYSELGEKLTKLGKEKERLLSEIEQNNATITQQREQLERLKKDFEVCDKKKNRSTWVSALSAILNIVLIMVMVLSNKGDHNSPNQSPTNTDTTASQIIDTK